MSEAERSEAAWTDEQMPADDRKLRALARRSLRRKAEFHKHLTAYVAVNIGLVIIWVVTGLASSSWFPWPLFPIFGWGIGVVAHARSVYGPSAKPMTETAVDREVARLSGRATQVMRTDASSAEVVRRFAEAHRLSRNGVEEVCSNEVVLHYFNPQMPDLNGDYVGSAGVRDFFERLAALTGNAVGIQPRASFLLGTELVVSRAVTGLTLGDPDLESDSVVIWRVVRGKIVEAWVIPAVNTVRRTRQLHGGGEP